MSRDTFSTRLLTWYDHHGRKALPWKRVRDPYRIWVSEIMLQQTQVATVIPYFERFIKRFPNIHTLAHARPDSVLHLWSGLGYYARAHNLHKAARQIVTDHGGQFPRDIESAVHLPGIGRSTAGAILALAFNQRHAILDGNVKRVLARYHAIRVPLIRRDVVDQLWQLAEQHTPHTRIADYTQAIMDLGATVCARANPDCVRCPVRIGCKARKLGTPRNFPVIAQRKTLPVKKVSMLLIRDTRNRVLLLKRPPAGLWGGLWGLPECTQKNVRAWCQAHIGLDIRPQKVWPTFRHSFSHFHLDITPIPARTTGLCDRVMENGDSVWYNVARPDARGLAAPVRKLLQQLENA